jgi:hypothetical protein
MFFLRSLERLRAKTVAAAAFDAAGQGFIRLARLALVSALLPNIVRRSRADGEHTALIRHFLGACGIRFRGRTLLCICPSACRDPESRWCDSNDLRTS